MPYWEWVNTEERALAGGSDHGGCVHKGHFLPWPLLVFSVLYDLVTLSQCVLLSSQGWDEPSETVNRVYESESTCLLLRCLGL